jgi:hypothetical protein
MTKRQIAEEAKKKYWQEHVESWQKSNIDQAAYCRRHGLKRHTFWYWKEKFSRDSSDISLVPVPIKINIPPTKKPLVVTIDNRFKIEVSGDFEAATLGKLIRTLERI